MDLKEGIKRRIRNAQKAVNSIKEDGHSVKDISDGYYTFGELYEFRKMYNANLFNEWANQGKYNVHKSLQHNDGELCFGGGWFIVVAILPMGQISNHYKMDDWELFKCKETKKALEPFDGHTGEDVLKRLKDVAINHG